MADAATADGRGHLHPPLTLLSSIAPEVPLALSFRSPDPLGMVGDEPVTRSEGANSLTLRFRLQSLPLRDGLGNPS